MDFLIKELLFHNSTHPKQLLAEYSVAVSQLKQGLQTPGGTFSALTNITVSIFL